MELPSCQEAQADAHASRLSSEINSYDTKGGHCVPLDLPSANSSQQP